jgi:hypothetical protein
MVSKNKFIKEKVISNQNRRGINTNNNHQEQISFGNADMVLDNNNMNNLMNNSSFNLGNGNNNQVNNNPSEQSAPNNQVMQVFNFNI